MYSTFPNPISSPHLLLRIADKDHNQSQLNLPRIQEPTADPKEKTKISTASKTPSPPQKKAEWYVCRYAGVHDERKERATKPSSPNPTQAF